MDQIAQTSRSVASVKFKWQRGDDAKTYDYFIPADLPVNVGDRVFVPTKHGETKVEVMEIKTESSVATA